MAHNLEAQIEVEGIDFVVQAFFEDGTEARDATAEVIAPDGSVLSAGKTDSQGRFKFSNDLKEKVEVTVEADAAEVRVRVCDRGPGVPEALRERIFEPFFRLPGHAEREGGVGLGLSLVRQIAERHGGREAVFPTDAGDPFFNVNPPEDLSAAEAML